MDLSPGAALPFIPIIAAVPVYHILFQAPRVPRDWLLNLSGLEREFLMEGDIPGEGIRDIDDTSNPDEWPDDPDDWSPPDGVEETPAGQMTGGRHRQWRGPHGDIVRRWDSGDAPGGRPIGPLGMTRRDGTFLPVVSSPIRSSWMMSFSVLSQMQGKDRCMLF